MMTQSGTCKRAGWLTGLTPFLVLGLWACDAEDPVAGDSTTNHLVTSPAQHVRLGFSSSLPIAGARSGSVTCASYSFSINGAANIAVDMGADVTFAYDRADLVPGGSVPIQITYTPTNDTGPEVSVDSAADVTMDVDVDEGCVAACFFLIPDPIFCGALAAMAGAIDSFSGGLASFALISAAGDFTAPLGADPPVVVSGTGDSAVLQFVGSDLVRATPASSLTLAPTPPGAFPGLGGAMAVISASGATLTSPLPLIPILEWQEPAPVIATIALPGTPGPSATLTLNRPLHWLGTSASASVNIDLIGVLGDVFGDPAPISVFSGNLGPELDVGDQICGDVPAPGQAACLATVAAGNLPFPALLPQAPDPLPAFPPLPEFASVQLTIDLDADDDGLLDGEEMQMGTNPDDADTDDDGLNDGAEAKVHGTNPLDPDTDDDGLGDGDEVNVHGTNPLDPDTDDDGLGDGDEVNVHGTDPLDPDTDDDLLNDGLEIEHGTNPLDPDSDDDGIIDGLDIEFIGNAVNALPDAAFKARGLRGALLEQLEAVEKKVAGDKEEGALQKIENIRRHLDGCPGQPDQNDWLIDCTGQLGIRALIDLLASNLTDS
jgi:hypothetical protein